MKEFNKQNKNNSLKSLIDKFKLFFKWFRKKIFCWPKKIIQNDFFKNPIVFWFIIFNLISNIANWIILILFISSINMDIILHYNVYFGVDEIGNWKNVFIMPLIGLIVFIINIFLAAYLFKNKERIASHVLLVASLMVQLILIIASVSIIIINY